MFVFFVFISASESSRKCVYLNEKLKLSEIIFFLLGVCPPLLTEKVCKVCSPATGLVALGRNLISITRAFYRH